MLRTSERGLREMAEGTGATVVDSTVRRSASDTPLRNSLVRGVRVAMAESADFGVTSGMRSPVDPVRPEPRIAGATVVFRSASTRASRTTSELTSVSVLARNSCCRRVIS